MNFYNKKDIQNIKSYRFDFIEISEEDRVFTITLNRPKKKNITPNHPISQKKLKYHGKLPDITKIFDDSTLENPERCNIPLIYQRYISYH